jgi:hypothetical protein
VLLKGDMLDYYSVSGCYILKPMSYSIWEEIQGGDREISLTSANLTDLSLAHSCPYVVTCPTPTRLPIINSLVQRTHKIDRCPKRLLSHVCLAKSPRAGEGPHRGVFPRGRMGHPSVSPLMIEG